MYNSIFCGGCLNNQNCKDESVELVELEVPAGLKVNACIVCKKLTIFHVMENLVSSCVLSKDELVHLVQVAPFELVSKPSLGVNQSPTF